MIASFLGSKELKQICSNLNEAEKKIIESKFNLLSISTYNPLLENFHSDVIAELLNPKSLHNEGGKFLNLFIDYLDGLGCNISISDYQSAVVEREKGRIDICIRDTVSNKAVIIENKINNAPDQHDQLKTYYEFLERRGNHVDLIIYLSLDGMKKAPLTNDPRIDSKIANIAAFKNSHNDLVNGWLMKAENKAETKDSISFINQYVKVTKHLASKAYKRSMKDLFYSEISKDNGFEKAQVVDRLLKGLSEYRADLFFEKLNGGYQPFTKSFRYRSNHWLFEGFIEGENIFKLDVRFFEDGGARIDFWNPGKTHETQAQTTKEKIESIGLIQSFKNGGFGGGKFKQFSYQEYKNIKKLDEDLFHFVTDFLKRLQENSLTNG